MGLTENEVLRERVVAGPFHPAFGYLVKSRVFLLAVLGRCALAGVKGNVRLFLHPRDVAHLTGHKRSNLARLAEKGITVSWVEDNAGEEGDFVVEPAGVRVKGDLMDALPMIPL
jgi:hypothetical protein